MLQSSQDAGENVATDQINSYIYQWYGHFHPRDTTTWHEVQYNTKVE